MVGGVGGQRARADPGAEAVEGHAGAAREGRRRVAHPAGQPAARARQLRVRVHLSSAVAVCRAAKLRGPGGPLLPGPLPVSRQRVCVGAGQRASGRNSLSVELQETVLLADHDRAGCGDRMEL